MDFSEVIKKRKSIRSFKSKPVEKEKIKKILELVNLAPSAGNLQAYKVFVVKDKKSQVALVEAALGQASIREAPVVLVFCANPQESALRYGERGEKLYSLQDATIAASYAQLAATYLGLGSVWIGAFYEREVQEILKTDLLPIVLLPIGYPRQDPDRPPRKSLKELVEAIDEQSALLI